MPVFIRFFGLFVLEKKIVVSNFFYLCVMIEVLFIQIPAGANRDKMFVGLRSVVSKECCAEVLGYGNKEVALRRLLGEALVRFALKKYWNLTSEDYRIDRGKENRGENVFLKPFTLFGCRKFLYFTFRGLRCLCRV